MTPKLPTLGRGTAAPLHFRRIELKYLLPERLLPMFRDRIAPYTQRDPFLVEHGVKDESYPVLSLYFDSVDLHFLQEKEAGLLARRKLRLRTYDTEFSPRSRTFLEIKRRYDATVSKDRIRSNLEGITTGMPVTGLLDSLLHSAEADDGVLSEARLLQSAYNLQPTTLVSYHRHPFVGRHDRRFRITLDHRMSAAWKPRQLLHEDMLTPIHPGWSILEVKFDHAVPAWFHDIVEDLELTRTAYSKYAWATIGMRQRMAEPLL